LACVTASDKKRQPASEDEANRWLARYTATYNSGDHSREPHSRIDDWLDHSPEDGIRAICCLERYCAFGARPNVVRLASAASEASAQLLQQPHRR
jgi:hypothetical protein